MDAGKGLRHRIEHATLGVIPAELKVEAKTVPSQGTSCFEVTVQAGRVQHRFLAGWAGAGWPADVRSLVQRFPHVQVVYAKRLSDGARAWLSENQFGWVDEAGGASIVLESGLVVVREAIAPVERLAGQDRWTRTMLAAVEAVLAGVTPTVEAVETATGMSRGGSANALARLERIGLVDRPAPKRGPKASRRVVDFDSLIDSYAVAAAAFRSRQKVVRLHRLWADPLEVFDVEIGRRLADMGAKWAVTGAAASTLLAPYLVDVTVVELYLDQAFLAARDRLASVLGGRIVEKGHRIEVREFPTSMSAMGPKVGGVQIALPARVYADLMASGGRSAEAGHHLREVRGLGPGS